ncbi:MAG: hypothetical protein ABIW82_07255 [Dokdonella sp.]
MQKPAKQALTFWLFATALILLALVTWLGAPRTPDGAGEAIGRVVAQTGVPALLVWWLARSRKPPWSWLQFGSVYLLAAIAFGLLLTMGRAHATDRCLATPMPTGTPLAHAMQSPRFAVAPGYLHLETLSSTLPSAAQ